MKKLLIVLIGVLCTGILSAQSDFIVVGSFKAKKGLTNTKKGLAADKIDSIKVSSGKYDLYQGATKLNPALTDTISGSSIYTKLVPDTVQHTDSYTIAASDWGKDQHILKATSVAITFPLNLNDWPVGGVMNFYGEGAGIMVFKKAAGVYFITDKDSIATSRKGQAVSWKKIAANTYFGVGSLTD